MGPHLLAGERRALENGSRACWAPSEQDIDGAGSSYRSCWIDHRDKGPHLLAGERRALENGSRACWAPSEQDIDGAGSSYRSCWIDHRDKKGDFASDRCPALPPEL